MPKNNNIKVFDKLVSRTKIYLVIIAILLIATIYMIPIMKKINTTEGQAQLKEKITFVKKIK